MTRDPAYRRPPGLIPNATPGTEPRHCSAGLAGKDSTGIGTFG
jgi:hypothetical protein